MQELPSGGAMFALEASEDEVLPLLADGVSIAAVNSPRSVVVSGAETAASAVAQEIAALGRRTSRLRVSHAFHSPLMEPMLAEFRTVAESVTYAPARIAVVSNLTGQAAGVGELESAEYWVRHVREAVRFADGIARLEEQGVTRFVELGPDGTLTALAQSGVSGDEEMLFASMLRKDRPETDTALAALSAAFTHGVTVDWPALFTGARTTALPTYAFQRERFWPEPAQDAVERRVDGWRYRVDWEPAAVPLPPAPVPGRWILLQPSDEDALAGIEEFVPGADRFTCPPRTDRAALARVLVQAAEGGTVAGVLSCLAPVGGVGTTLALVQALGDASLTVPLWTVTHGAVSTDGPAEEPADPAQAAVWGLGRVAALEHPDRWGGLVDVPARQPDRHALAGIAAALVSGEDQIAVRGPELLARRLVHAPVSATSAPVTAWTPRGPVLVTGGT
ncbi:acyltransferase domain-containing protein, partial [Streptomyces sp. NPDC005195]|uniref:acyltransferase domain-containing protein n=1 Tax=Streptomyces sp. NPDC005195 TaxID=3154561 RepID=UPI0033B3F59C